MNAEEISGLDRSSGAHRLPPDEMGVEYAAAKGHNRRRCGMKAVSIMWRRNCAWRLCAALVVFALMPWHSASASRSTVGCRVELDRDVLPAGAGGTAIVKVTLDAAKPESSAKRPRINLAVVLDRSGSMGGDKIEKAKDAAIEALRRLGPQDIFSLVIYDDTVETVVPAQSASNTEWIEARIRDIRAGNSTALFSGVSQGAAEVRKHVEERFVHRILLLSDGLANVGPSAPRDLGRLGEGLRKEGISVTTIGVGTDYNEELMSELARESDGNTYFAESSRDLTRIFTEELGDVLSVVATTVNIIITFPEGVVPVRFVGRDGRIRGHSAELHLNQLYGGQEKYALVEVRLPEVRAGERREIASAVVTYQDALTGRSANSSGVVMATFSENRKDVDRSERAEVVKTYTLNVTADDQEHALRLNREGKYKESSAVLKEAAQKLDRIGNKYGDESLRARASGMEAQAVMLEADKPMPQSASKAMQADSWQTMNQQRAK